MLKALANGYARAGQPQQAVTDLQGAEHGLGECRASMKRRWAQRWPRARTRIAETWLHYAMAAFRSDPQHPDSGSEFEQARGDTARAINYYRASLQGHAAPGSAARSWRRSLGCPRPPRLRACPARSRRRTSPACWLRGTPAACPAHRPSPICPAIGYLYGYYCPAGFAPSAPNGQPTSLPNNGTTGGPSGVVPPYMTNPAAQPESTGKGRPNQIAPQSRLDQGAYNLPSQAEVALRVREAIARELGESGAAVEIASQPTFGTMPQPETMTASRGLSRARAPAVAPERSTDARNGPNSPALPCTPPSRSS